MIPNPVRPLLPIAVSIGFYTGLLRHWENIAMFFLILFLLLAEALHAEYRGATRSWQVAWIAFWSSVTLTMLAAIFSWLVPLVLWCLAVTLVYALRTGTTAKGATATAWRSSELMFLKRRQALGRHYRWRIALAVTPHLAYIFVLNLLLAAVALQMVAFAALVAAVGRELTVYGLFGGFAAMLVILVVLVPLVFGVFATGIAPILHRPLHTLLLALMGVEPKPASFWRALVSNLLLSVLNLGVYVAGAAWSTVTLWGPLIPGGGSAASLSLTFPFLGLLFLRILLSDAVLLESNRLRATPLRLLRALVRMPVGTVEMMLWQFTSIVGLFLFPLSLLSIGVLEMKLHGVPYWQAVPVSVVGLVAIAYMNAALFLRLNLHRLVFLQQVGDTGRAATHP